MKIASAPTKERLNNLINEFYYTKNCIINEKNEVFNTKLNKKLGYVKNIKNRFIYFTN
jgi:hypothetical protein